EINEREKTKFLGEAGALLFPVDWPEPFGLVMIEAMACGTPVLAFRCGSIPEIIENGITGTVVDSEQEAVAALPALLSYDRRAVRRRFEEKFTATRMAKDYVSTYRQLLRIRSSNGARRSRWPGRDGLNDGNGSIPLSIEKPLPALPQAGMNSGGRSKQDSRRFIHDVVKALPPAQDVES
ncbi:MAG: glycosyltransferase, partial [Xanthobacteraceae bacterium]